jgi:hypothetical protein
MLKFNMLGSAFSALQRLGGAAAESGVRALATSAGTRANTAKPRTAAAKTAAAGKSAAGKAAAGKAPRASGKQGKPHPVSGNGAPASAKPAAAARAAPSSPPSPPRALTAFSLFLKASPSRFFPPGVPGQDGMRRAAEAWRSMSDRDKVRDVVVVVWYCC